MGRWSPPRVRGPGARAPGQPLAGHSPGRSPSRWQPRSAVLGQAAAPGLPGTCGVCASFAPQYLSVWASPSKPPDPCLVPQPGHGLRIPTRPHQASLPPPATQEDTAPLPAPARRQQAGITPTASCSTPCPSPLPCHWPFQSTVCSEEGQPLECRPSESSPGRTSGPRNRPKSPGTSLSYLSPSPEPTPCWAPTRLSPGASRTPGERLADPLPRDPVSPCGALPWGAAPTPPGGLSPLGHEPHWARPLTSRTDQTPPLGPPVPAQLSAQQTTDASVRGRCQPLRDPEGAVDGRPCPGGGQFMASTTWPVA